MCLAGGQECHASTLQFAVDGDTRDIEELSVLDLDVLAAILHVEQEFALRGRQLGLLAFQVALRAGDRHPLHGAHADQVALKLGDRRKHIEQQPSDWVGGVVPAAAEVQRNALDR